MMALLHVRWRRSTGCGGGAAAGEGRIHECLREHMEYLTPNCASEEVSTASSAVGAASCVALPWRS